MNDPEMSPALSDEAVKQIKDEVALMHQEVERRFLAAKVHEEGRELWRRVFAATVRGETTQTAAKWADRAVAEYRERFEPVIQREPG